MDLSYPEWKDIDEFGFSEELWRKANPPINERRAKEGLPPYDETIPPPGESPQ